MKSTPRQSRTTIVVLRISYFVDLDQEFRVTLTDASMAHYYTNTMYPIYTSIYAQLYEV
jgi:hypothetical protein